VPEATKGKGVPEGVERCDRFGEDTDDACHFPNLASSKCPYIRFEKGEIDEDEVHRIMAGED